MFDKRTVTIIIIVAAVALLAGFLLYTSSGDGGTDGNGDNHNDTGNSVVMNVNEYRSDGTFDVNNTTKTVHLEYASLDPGDTLILEGMVIQPPICKYIDRFGMELTSLTLGGGAKWPLVILVEGNVTASYQSEDNVEITIHINEYDIYQEYRNEEWHMYGEFPEEAIFNGEYTLGEIIVPPSQVNTVEG